MSRDITCDCVNDASALRYAVLMATHGMIGAVAVVGNGIVFGIEC